MLINNANNKNNHWTAQKLVNLSRNLGQGYCPGSEKTETVKKTDCWTTDKFIAMSRYLSSAYGVDF